MSSDETGAGVDARLRSARIIWAAMLGSVFFYAVIGFVLRPPALSWRALSFAGERGSVAMAVTAILLYTAGLFASVLVAPKVLQSFLRRGEREQKPELIQTGFILALAVCESGALVGLLILFLIGSWHAFLLMAISALMLVLLRPRREQVASASYKLGKASKDGRDA